MFLEALFSSVPAVSQKKELCNAKTLCNLTDSCANCSKYVSELQTLESQLQFHKDELESTRDELQMALKSRDETLLEMEMLSQMLFEQANAMVKVERERVWALMREKSRLMAEMKRAD